MRQSPEQLEPGRDDQSTYFVRFNAGKQSLALDLPHPLARGVVEDLARVSDVVVENFLPGVMLKLGLDYESLSLIRPDLIYCSISGYGQTGPLRDWPAFAHTIAAMAGITHLEANQEAAPHVGYFQTADVLAATHPFGALLAALYRRSRPCLCTSTAVSMLYCLTSTELLCFAGPANGRSGVPGPR